MHEDIYFLNPLEALRIAAEQNRWGENNYFLQVCYYDGKKIESDLVNLIHLPIDNLLEGLAYGTFRIPSKIDFTGLKVSDEVKVNVELNFNMSIQQVQMYRNQFNAQYLHTMKNSMPDFSEPLRFYLSSSSSTRVMQHVSKNIADTLKEMGYDVLFELSHGMEDTSSLKKMSEFNPHATININHLHNSFLNDAVFNFVWFQDAMPILHSSQKIALRKRDTVFHLVKAHGELLKNKNIASIYQSFCINTKVYKNRESIKREEKIVLIASSCKDALDSVAHPKKIEIVQILLDNYMTDENKTEEKQMHFYYSIIKDFNITMLELGKLVNYVERDGLLLHMISLGLNYKLEIYGWGWDKTPEFKDYYKGILPYGEDISKVYNSAKYTFVLGGYVLQQRTLEAAASGCIPLVHDSRYNNIGSTDESCFNESLIFFKYPNEVASLLNMEYKLNLDCIVKANSYEKFLKKIIRIIEKNLDA